MRKPEWFCGDSEEWRLVGKTASALESKEKWRKRGRRLDFEAVMERAGMAGLWGIPIGGIVGSFVMAAPAAGGMSVIAGIVGLMLGGAGGGVGLGLLGMLGGALLSGVNFAGEKMFAAKFSLASATAAKKIAEERAKVLFKNAKMAERELEKELLWGESRDLARTIRTSVEAIKERVEANAKADARVADIAETERSVALKIRRANPEMFVSADSDEEIATSLEGRLAKMGARGEEGLAAVALARVALKSEKEDSQEKRELIRLIETDIPKLLEAWERVPKESRDKEDDHLGCSPEESLRRGFSAALTRATELRGIQTRKAALATEAEARVIESRVSGTESVSGFKI